MLIYIVSFILTAILFYFAQKYYILYSDGKNYLTTAKCRHYFWLFVIFFLLSLLPIGLVSGLRYNVGTDYMYTYYPSFYLIMNNQFHYTEWGFTALNQIIAYFTADAQWLFIITSFIFVYALLKGIIKYSHNVLISILVVFLSLIYFTSLNNVRQLIAVAICFLGFKEIIKKRFLYYLFYIVLACQFHITALIMILPYFIINNCNFIKKNVILWMTIGVAIVIIISPITLFIIEHTKYAYFLNGVFTNHEKTYTNLLYSFIYLMISYLFLYKTLKTNKINYSLIIFQYAFFLMQILSFIIPASEVILRLSQYFIIFQTLLIPTLVYSQGKLSKSVWPWLVLLFYFCTYFPYFYYFIIVNGYHCVLPYQSIFHFWVV